MTLISDPPQPFGPGNPPINAESDPIPMDPDQRPQPDDLAQGDGSETE